MVRVYYHDNLPTDQRLPHEGLPASLADLAELGVFASNIQDRAEVDRIAAEKGYKNRDEVFTPARNGGGVTGRFQCRRNVWAPSTTR
jgi:1,2-dihydroxy-3-keto-5-methylthiopentene dioxygenase